MAWVFDRVRCSGWGLGDRIGLIKVASGPLPFPPSVFDILFSKDSIVHIPDKHALMAEIFCVMNPGGWFVASDWMIGHDEVPSSQMAAYILTEGLGFGMSSPRQYWDAMRAAGFLAIDAASRNGFYRKVAAEELARLRGPFGTTISV